MTSPGDGWCGLLGLGFEGGKGLLAEGGWMMCEGEEVDGGVQAAEVLLSNEAGGSPSL